MATVLNFGWSSLNVLPEFLQRGVSNTIECRLSRNGERPTITSGTCTVYDSTGSVASTGALTPTQEEGTSSYTFTPSASYAFGEGWRVVWEVVTDGGTQTVENEAMLCRRRLMCPVTTDIIWGLCPTLKPTVRGDDDEEVDDVDAITSLTAEQQTTILNIGWETILARLLEQGKRPFLVVGEHALRAVTTATALHLIYTSLSNHQYEAWSALAEKYGAEAEACWLRLKLDYDENQDGVVDARVAARPSGYVLGRRR